MRKTTTLAMALLPAATLFFGCDKGSDEKGTPDVTGPEILYYEPDPNDVFAVNDTIFLQADVTDEFRITRFFSQINKGNRYYSSLA
jgi:hypothetical protein